jgi:hypothetical protein
MAKRAPNRAGRAKTASSATSTSPRLPAIVAGAWAMGTGVGRAALKAAQDVLGAAGRLAARATTAAGPKTMGLARPPTTGDSRLPEAQLNAIAEAGRKPLARHVSQPAKAGTRRRRRKTA